GARPLLARLLVRARGRWDPRRHRRRRDRRVGREAAERARLARGSLCHDLHGPRDRPRERERLAPRPADRARRGKAREEASRLALRRRVERPAMAAPDKLPCVRFEDEDLLVLEKPPGVNTHASDVHAQAGFYEWARGRRPAWGELGLQHRLDKETSGLLVF